MAVFAFVETDNQETSLKNCRTISLTKAFVEANYDELKLITHGLLPDDICKWGSLGYRKRFESECDGDSQLVKLCIDNVSHFRQIHIGFLPQSLTHLSLTKCDQRWSINTRLFPRESDLISLENNLICGTPDLSALPSNIIDLSLSKNLLTGPIHFCGLPAQMQTLDLSHNHIRQNTIIYSHLPKGLGFIDLKFNKIVRTRPAAGQSRVTDPDFFFGLTKRGLF